MFKNLKIFPKILLSCILIAVIPLAGFIYQINLNQKEQNKVVEQGLSTFAEVIGVEVDNWVDKNLRNTRLLTGLESFQEMNGQEQIPLLEAAKQNLEWVSLIFVKDLNGDAIARSDGKPLLNYAEREYFKQVITGAPVGQQVLIGKVNPVPLHCFAVPIENVRNIPVGVITQCSSLVSISNIVTSSKTGLTGFALLVDSQNRLIAHGEAGGQLAGKLQDFSEHPALQLNDGSVETLDFEGEKRVFITRSVGPGWRLIVQQDYDEAYNNYLSSIQNALILAVITVLVTLILAFMISLNISAPVKKLTEIANAYSKGIFIDNVVGKDRNDEVGELAKAVSRMAKTIQMAMTRLRKAARK